MDTHTARFPIAQLVEQLTVNQRVTGSSPFREPLSFLFRNSSVGVDIGRC